MTQNRTLSLILPAFGAAIIAALAQIVIPIGAVPITLQTFAVGLVAAILKPREATLAATLYLILGAIGLPVFAGGGGGLQVRISYLAGAPLKLTRLSSLVHPLSFSDNTKSFSSISNENSAICLPPLALFVFFCENCLF